MNLFSEEFKSLCDENNIPYRSRRSTADWENPSYDIEGLKREEILREVESHLPGYAINSIYS